MERIAPLLLVCLIGCSANAQSKTELEAQLVHRHAQLMEAQRINAIIGGKLDQAVAERDEARLNAVRLEGQVANRDLVIGWKDEALAEAAAQTDPLAAGLGTGGSVAAIWVLVALLRSGLLKKGGGDAADPADAPA